MSRRETEGAAAQDAHHGPRTKRWTEQRWLVDNIIAANGMDWDQPRSAYLSAPMGPEANADFAALRARIKKFADAAPAFEVVARRRQAKAVAAEQAGQQVTARDNYFMAAIHWGAAQWPLDANTAQNLFYNGKKRECFGSYARLADRRVEPVWIPLGDQKLPAWFHLPPGYSGGKLPVVISVPGMDSFKEASVALYGDALLNRGFAVLAVDGPGQYESPVLGIYMRMEAWEATGRACMDWLAARPEVDRERVVITGRSFGSFAATIAASGEPRLKACAVSAVCHEPGFHTIFEEASPTFKVRFMYMCNMTDEAEFDRFRQSMTWEGYVETLRMPYLALAGEADELSPLHNTERLIDTLTGPKRLVVYGDARHSFAGASSAALGPHPNALIGDWLAARVRGEPMANERWDVDTAGRVTVKGL